MRVLVAGAYYFGVDTLFYFLNRHAKRILCFHNVLPDELYRADLSVAGVMRLSEFEQIVRFCMKRFPISVDMDDCKSLTLTFDDGYRNQYSIVYKCLKRIGVPGCIFISGQKDSPLVIDIIDHWNLLAPKAVVGNRSQFWHDQIWPVYQADWQHRGRAAVQFCDDRYPIVDAFEMMSAEYREERFGCITDSELDEMRKDGWLIGWHTKSHYPLAYLPESELKRELQPIDNKMLSHCFSYPYGVESQVGSDAIKCVRDLGFPCAVSDTMYSPLNTSAYFMPRLQVPADKYRVDYELSGFGHFMRTHHLLPYARR